MKKVLDEFIKNSQTDFSTLLDKRGLLAFFSFLSALQNWHKNSKFFKVAVLRSDSMKGNYGGLIFILKKKI